MKGEIKKINSSTGYIYPVTHASAVFLNKNETVAEKLRELEELVVNNEGLNYLSDVETPEASTGEILTHIRGVWKSKNLGGNMNIDLEIYGLKLGFPEIKPYTLEDYQVAFDNMQGINNALENASRLGYSQVTLPKGIYAFCYPYSVYIPNNITLNLGGSTIRTMFESDARSPYDSSTSAFYNLGGNLFQMKGVNNAHLINGIIIGDAYDRSFTDPKEASIEGTYGVSINSGSNYCSITHCEISGFMGDNINFTAGGKVRGGFSTGAILGDLNAATGVEIPGVIGTTTTMYTPMINLPLPISDYKVFSLAGQGYSRTTSLNNKKIDVYYYNEEGVFLGRLRNRKVHTPMPIARKATKYRMKFYDETDISKNFNIFMDYGGDSHHNVVEFNELYDGHRGGITLGGSYNFIQYNNIRENGKSSYDHAFLDGVPAFTDTTRYAINQEDSFGDNNSISYNHITGGFHGLLLRGYSHFVDHNVFDNVENAVVLYDVDYATITNNYIQQGNFQLFGSSLDGRVQIIGNYLGNLDLTGGTYDCVVTDNHIHGNINIADARFERNHVAFSTSGSIMGERFKDNRFYRHKSKAGVSIDAVLHNFSTSANTVFHENNEFTDLNLIFNGRTGYVSIKGCKITRGKFQTTASPLGLTVVIDNCELVDCQLEPRTSNIPKQLKFTVKNSILTVSLTSSLTNIIKIFSGNAVGVVDVYVHNCKLKISKSLPIIIETNYLYVDQVNLEFLNNELEYTGEGVLYPQLFREGRTGSAYVAGNKFIKIAHVTPLASAKFKLYDPYVSSPSEPTSGYFYLGETWKNAVISPGGYRKWIAITEGHANNKAWQPTTAYLVGDNVYAGDQVYYCTIAGTSGSTAPSHTKGVIADGTATFAFLGAKAVFKPYGLIST